ncbi:MAG: FMN-binding protein [Desulfosalsimonadaceae bacterium]
MLKKITVILHVMLGLMVFLPLTCHAFTILTKDEALKTIFGESAKIVTETKELSGPPLEKITARLDGTMVFTQEGSESEEVEEQSSVDFLFATKDGKKYGVAIIDVEPGKWGPVEFIVAMDLQGTVRTVKVMSYEEIRGRPIAETGFMNQYKGKSSKSALTVGKDIIGISGATISSKAATFTVKKAIVMYEEFYLNK